MNLPLQISTIFLLLLLMKPVVLTGQYLPSEKRVDRNREKEKEDLDVLNHWLKWNNPGSLLIDYLNQQAATCYTRRDQEINQLSTKKDWMQRQDFVKGKLQQLIGLFPPKNPLHPTITGIIQKDGYRIEKIIFESRPQFYVTGCLFIPEKPAGKVPAVLNLIGHEQESFRAELDQLVMINLVKKGIIVMTIDPPGQGENVQYFDTEIGVSSIGYSVIEHCYFGNQCFLNGASSASYFVWDAIRAIDYLVTRPEVDPDRIGATGFSGGGTITSYLAALDDRVKVAVPSSWSTASRRQLETKGAQDAETELYRGLLEGITFEDLLEVRAPKPALLTFVSRDQYLTLQGARDAYAEVMKSYQAFDKPENFKLVEDDSRHWLTPKIRLAIYTFFQSNFNLEIDSTEEEIILLSKDELQVTTTGQIGTSMDGKMIFDINRDQANSLMNKIEKSRQNANQHLAEVLKKAPEISGYESRSQQVTQAFINGRYQRDGYTLTKYALERGKDYPLPFLLFCPNEPFGRRPVLIYLHPEGKAHDAEVGGTIESLVKSGYIVAAIDPLGVGETTNTAARGLAPGYTGALIGKSIVGLQASDINQITEYLKTLPDVDSNKIGALAFDEMCIPLIHAAAFNGSIKSVLLIRPLISYRSVVMNRLYKIGLTKNEGGGTGHPYEIDFDWGIPGVLTAYDLPDLIASLAPRKVAIVDAQDQMLKTVSQQIAFEELAFPRKVYSQSALPSNLEIITDTANIRSFLLEFWR